MPERKRYAQVGLGGRHVMYRKAVTEKFADSCQMVGLCDINEGRLKLAVDEAKKETGADVPGYPAEDFDRMIAQCKPEVVIVTTKDRHHDEYLVRAMEAGCDTITEKPMTIDAQRCQRIVDTVKKTGRSCRVTFNYRYSPPRTQVKDLLMSGVIGEVLSVDFHWMLDTRHGADYFRRWHRDKANSGGLMVHKATHHFDLVNWWLSAVPEKVYASGHRKFYTPQTGDRYGFTNRGQRCHGCPESDKCPFYIDIANNEGLRRLYFDNEQFDGYQRDRCVFSADINIEDSMNVVVDYSTGAKLTYSLNAFNPWEGYMIAFNGSRGRLEHMCQETVYINADGSVPGQLKPEGTWIRIYPHFGSAYDVEVRKGEGGHGGGDDPLLEGIFLADPPADKYQRAADQRGGAYSILCGVAANRSMETGAPVVIDELVQNIGRPDYPEMPAPDQPLPVPTKGVRSAGQ